jgi:uncharacterized LabA/DUF88 family protein
VIQRPSAAILVDAENLYGGANNFRAFDVEKFMARLAEACAAHGVGDIAFGRAYGNWFARNDQKAAQAMRRRFDQTEHFEAVYVNSNKPNAADAFITWDAAVLTSNPMIDTVVLVSDDKDFAVVALRLRESGRRVVVLGQNEMLGLVDQLRDLAVQVIERFTPDSENRLRFPDVLREMRSQLGIDGETPLLRGYRRPSDALRTALVGTDYQVVVDGPNAYVQLPALQFRSPSAGPSTREWGDEHTDVLRWYFASDDDEV